ncbi:MAG TPA: hypothetical protein VGP53_00955, partial [Acidimicrobiales bacterium]|nr:hypothetical protein [Acidimicrobiales bacterium]
MSGAPQLERSVLEAKERDELHAIADALGQKPAARAKKTELVDLILRATGVAPAEEPSEPAKPRRPTRKKVTAAAAANGDAAPAPDGPHEGLPPAVNGAEVGETSVPVDGPGPAPAAEPPTPVASA